MTERREETASCRVTRSERALIEAAAARDGRTYVSNWLRAVILDRLEEEFGVQAVRSKGSRGGVDSDGQTT